MTTQQLKEKLRKSLRISSDFLDDELEDLIAACRKDLKRIGVVDYESTSDPLIFQAIKLYAKSNLDFNNDGERFEKAYTLLAQSISLSREYYEE